MNRNSQWYNVLAKIEECQRNLEYLMQQNPNLPLIEIDIVLNKLSIIYDTLMTIKLKSAVNEETGFLSRNSSLINKIIKESVFEEEKHHTTSRTDEVHSNSNEPIIPKEINTNLESTEQPISTNTPSSTVNSSSTSENKNEVYSPKTVADTFVKPSKTIAEMMEEMHRKKDSLISQHFKSIKDLRSAIGLNDKVMFIRELFNNNVENYNYVMEQLNNCSNMDEAMTILEKNINVHSDSQAIKQLLELVYRRFMN